MKLFFGLNPTPNQISEMNLKAGSPRSFSDDAPKPSQRNPRPAPTPSPSVQPRPSTPRNNATAPSTPSSTPFGAERPAAVNPTAAAAADIASRFGAESPADTPKTQTAPPVAPRSDSPKPPAGGIPFVPPPSPSRSTAADSGQSSSAKPETDKSHVAMPSDANPQPSPAAAEAPKPPSPNSEMEKMREELERMRAELEKYKQPAATQQNTEINPQEAKASDIPLPPPLPKQENSPKRQETPTEAIPAVLVDDNAYDGNATIQLKAYSGKTMTITGDTIVNFSNTRTLNGDDFQYLDHNEQYRISRQGSKWIITPGMNTKNATMLNYLPLTGPEVLEDEDTISVSIPGSNVHKMMLTVKFMS